jgi:tetratricopeptide (TPR) repeat protein
MAALVRTTGVRAAAAADLLRLCAFLAPDDIPIGVLQGGAREMPDPLRGALADDLELDRTVAALHRFSLVERSGDGLRVHRLVQAVVREPLEHDERDGWLAAAIRLLRDGFPDDADSTEHWPLCGRLVAHVRFAEQMASARRIEPQALSWLLQRASIYLRARGELGMSRLLCERALAIREEVLGPEHVETAESVYEMGWLLAQQGELPPAKLLLERALSVRERVLPPDHPDIASSLNSLAYVLRRQGRMEAARALLERAVAIYERARGSDHPDTALQPQQSGVLGEGAG